METECSAKHYVSTRISKRIEGLGVAVQLVYHTLMSETEKAKTTADASASAGKPKKDEKAERLAEALRANLRRRKQAAKQSKADDE